MQKMIFETTCVSPKDDGSTHVVLHGSTDTKESFRGPAPNSTLSLWPNATMAAGFKVGKKYELVEVKPEPVVVPAPTPAPTPAPIPSPVPVPVVEVVSEPKAE